MKFTLLLLSCKQYNKIIEIAINRWQTKTAWFFIFELPTLEDRI